MSERHKAVVAVWLVLMKGGKVLLQLRQNTGYMDGKYDMAASGHIEAGERLEDGAIREAKEEIGINVDKSNVSLLTAEYDEKDNYMRFFFVCSQYDGKPQIMEPEKIAELRWFDLEDLPENLTIGTKRALDRIKRGVFFDIG